MARIAPRKSQVNRPEDETEGQGTGREGIDLDVTPAAGIGYPIEQDLPAIEDAKHQEQIGQRADNGGVGVRSSSQKRRGRLLGDSAHEPKTQATRSETEATDRVTPSPATIMGRYPWNMLPPGELLHRFRGGRAACRFADQGCAGFGMMSKSKYLAEMVL